MSLQPRRVAIVGTGPQAWRYGQALTASPRWALVGVLGRHPDRLRPWATVTMPCDTWPALARCRPEAVVIANAVTQHATDVEEALYYGLHVLAEKPLALDLATYDRLVARAAEAGWNLSVALRKRLNQTTLRLLRWLTRLHRPPPSHLSAQVSVPRAAAYYASPTKGDPALAGGGVLWHQGMHALDLMIQCAGPVASAAVVGEGWPIEQTAHVALTFRSGATGTLDVTTANPVSRDVLTFTFPTGRSLTVTDTRWGRWPWRYQPGTVESLVAHWADDLDGEARGLLRASSSREVHRVLMECSASVGISC